MKDPVRRLIFSGLFASLCCVATLYPRFPTPFGYIHAGDAFVLLAAYLLGPVWGGLAAGLGSGLADLLAGYAQYIPGTVVIKCLMALTAGALLRRLGKARPLGAAIAAGVVAELIMVVGYLAYESLLLGYGAGALASVPTNLIQAAFGAAVAAFLHVALAKTDISNYLS